MKKIIIVTFLFLSCSILVAQTNNFWTKKADFANFKRERAVGISINNIGYLGTGIDTTETVKNDWWAYDAILDTWTQKATVPGSVRRDAVGFSVDGYGYVGMGIDSSEAFLGTPLSDFYQYNPTSNVWIQKATYPGGTGNGVYFATAFSLDSKGFVCCGKIGADSYIDDVWEYKPLTDQWTKKSDYPGGARYQLSSFVVDNFAYVGLGADYNTYRKDIYEYQIGSDTWIRKNDFAGGERGSASTFTLGQRGFVCLGVDGGLKNDLWEYNPSLDTWTVRASYGGSARKGAVSFSAFGKGYVGTGNGYSGKKASMYEYSPVAILSVEENVFESTISIFPNPIIDHFTIQSNEGNEMGYSLYSLEGKLIKTINASSSIIQQVDRNEISAGIYVLIAVDENSKVVGTKKIIFL